MYFVKYGDKYLHDPRIDGCIVLDLSFDGEENSCGFCDFTIYPNHPMYGKLKERDADNPIEVYDDNILLFSGFIYELGKEFYLDGHVKCKGELDYLNESIVRPYSTLAKGYGTLAPNTVNGYFEWLIEQHNKQVESNKQFTIGINEGSHLDSNNYIYRENYQYPKTIDEISDKLLNSEGIGGYLRVRHEGDIRYIDYLFEWTDTNTQILDFGVNLMDYAQTDDSLDVATFVVPLGAKMSSTEYAYNDGYFVSTDKTVNSNKEYYTKSDDGGYSSCSNLTAFESGVTYYEYNESNDESDLSLSIETLDDSVYTVFCEDGYVKSGDCIYCEEAVEKYGWIGTTYNNTDITLRENLISSGILHLKELISPKRTIEIKAVDMHLVNPDIKPIRIGEYVRVRSKPHNLDSYFLCTKIDLDLNNPENSVYTLGTTFDTLTGQQNKKINELNATINQQVEDAKANQGVTNKAILESAAARKEANNAYNESVKATEQAIAAQKKADNATSKVELVENAVTEVKADTLEAWREAQESSLAAKKAQLDANDASTAAGEATAITNEIKKQIDDVQGDATSLRDAIEKQIETKTSSMTADYVKTTELTETVTSLQSDITQSAAGIEANVAQDYAKKTDLTDVETKLNVSLKVQSDSITETVKEVSTVKMDVSTAQDAADEATRLANSAQSKADEAGENASAAHAAADTAQEHADQAQSDLKDLDEAVSATFSEVIKKAGSIETTVGEVKTKLSDLAVGGVNLYLGTKEFEGDSWINLDQWESWTPEQYWPYKEYGRWGAWQGIHQKINVVEGEVYTFSFLASGDDNCLMNVYTDWDSTATNPDHFELGAPSNGTYTRYSVTFTAIETGEIAPRVENTNDSWLQVCALKLEHGNMATDWSPSPLDDYDKISKLTQTAEGFEAKVEEAGKTASSFLSFTDLGLIVGDLLKEQLGNNVLIDENGVSIRDGGSVLASFTAGGMRFEKPVVFTADGIFLNNGDAYCALGQNQVLFSHPTGYYMHGTQEIMFSANITRQLSGAVFCWCGYQNGASTNSNWLYFFVPKSHVINHGGAGVRMSDPYLGVMKYLYVSNGGASGVSSNASTGTTNGIAWNNQNYVLRYVIGV